MGEISIGERKDHEIAWHIWLQIAAASSKLEEVRCAQLGMTKGEIVNRAISRANAVLEEHGDLGTAALSAAAVSLGILEEMGFGGSVRVAPTAKASVEGGL